MSHTHTHTHTQAQGSPVCSATWKYQQRFCAICDCNFSSFQQKHDGDKTFPQAGKMLFSLHSTGDPGGCLSTRGLSPREHMKERYRGKGGLDNKWPPRPCLLALRACVPIIPSPASLSLQPQPPPLSASDPSLFSPPSAPWVTMVKNGALELQSCRA